MMKLLRENSGGLSAFNPLQPGVTFLYPLKRSGGIEKQHWGLMG